MVRFHDVATKLMIMPKQKLSPQAARAKAARDKAYAMTDERREKKAHAQRMRRKSPAKAAGKDWDHKDKTWKTPKANRGNDGMGTKKEGKENYKF